MARLLLRWNLYTTVSRDLAVIVEEPGKPPRLLEAGEALALAAKVLDGGGTVVVDEFQRLPERYWQLLATRHPRGRLVLLASSLSVSQRVFDERSPLLGLVQPVKMGVIGYADTIVSLLPRLGARGALLWGLLLREPWLAPMAAGKLGASPWGFLAREAQALAQVSKGLVGEVFTEEERRLTALYEAVLRLLGAGVWSSSKLAGILYRRGLLASPSPGVVTGVLDKMAEMGLVARTRLWRTRGAKVYYRHASPLLAIVFGLAERYGIDEGTPVEPRALEEAAKSLYARELQFALGELMAEYHGGIHAYTILPDGAGDVDVVVLDRRGRRVVAAYEVKLGACSSDDMRLALQRGEAVGARRIGVVCVGGIESEPPAGVEALTAKDVARIAVEVARRTVASLRAQP